MIMKFSKKGRQIVASVICIILVVALVVPLLLTTFF